MRGTITLKNRIKYIHSDHPLKRYLQPTLFIDSYGEEIKSGDTIEFYTQDSIFPSNGTVSIINGLRVDCFNTLLNKWTYYVIDTSQPEN